MTVAQASTQWQQLKHLKGLDGATAGSLQRWSSTRRRKKRSTPLRSLNLLPLLQGPVGWSLLALLGLAMLAWSWQLLLATIAGMVVMALIYGGQSQSWQAYWLSWQKALQGINRRFLVAVGGGGVAALSTFMAASLWMESEHPWSAAAAILQGLGTLAVLGVVLWQQWTSQTSQTERYFDQGLGDLSHSDPLKRLIAVRQLSRRFHRFDPDQQRSIADAFRLLLVQEPEKIVRQATLEGLQSLQASYPLTKDMNRDQPNPSGPRTPLNLQPRTSL